MTKARGVYTREIEGVEYKFLLTMWALAEIEDRIGVKSLEDFQDKVNSGSFKVLTEIVLVLLNGAEPDTPYTHDVFKKWPGDPHLVTDIINQTFMLGGFYKPQDENNTSDDTEGN